MHLFFTVMQIEKSRLPLKLNKQFKTTEINIYIYAHMTCFGDFPGWSQALHIFAATMLKCIALS